jgi:hypothetical protein
MKLRITTEQYNAILIREQKERSNKMQLTENVLMGFSKMIGVTLTGRNKIDAEKALDNKDIILKIKNTLEDKGKLKSLVDSLEEKGTKEPNSRIAKDAQKIIDDYNALATKNGLKDMLGLDALTNLNDLDKSSKN